MMEQGRGVIPANRIHNGVMGYPYYADYNATSSVIELTKSIGGSNSLKVRVRGRSRLRSDAHARAEYTDEMLEQVNQKILFAATRNQTRSPHYSHFSRPTTVPT